MRHGTYISLRGIEPDIIMLHTTQKFYGPTVVTFVSAELVSFLSVRNLK
jgi:hypothetical protein